MRLKTKWANKDKERSIEEIAGALAFTVWRIGMQSVLNLENENFQTDTQSQRVDLVDEFVIFLTHLTDRMAYAQDIDDDQRMRLIKTLALRLAQFDHEDRQLCDGPGEYHGAFIELLNARMEDYSECKWTAEEGPGFSMTRTLGDHVTSKMGERDRKWITTYVQEIEVPEAQKTLKRAIRSLLGWEV